MMKRPTRHKLTIRVAPYLYKALMEHAQKFDKRQSAVVTEALRAFLKIGEQEKE